MDLHIGSFLLHIDGGVISLILFILIPTILGIIKKKKKEVGVVFEYLNEKKNDTITDIKKYILRNEKGRKEAKKYVKKREESLENQTKIHRTFLLEFSGDILASQVRKLREEVTAILQTADKEDEVVINLESPGGTVNGYGLAASQLQRIKDAGLKLTITVDKVAASGGYMMACIGQKIIASPFAYIGSVGVVAEFPNFNRVLQKFGIDYKTYTAGESKRTVGPLAPITKEGEKKFKDSLTSIHTQFKNHVKKNRPSVDIKKIATGEHWTAQESLEMGLVDEIRTSDDYVVDRIATSHVYNVNFHEPKEKKGLLDILFGSAADAVIGRIEKFLQKKSSETLF